MKIKTIIMFILVAAIVAFMVFLWAVDVNGTEEIDLSTLKSPKIITAAATSAPTFSTNSMMDFLKNRYDFVLIGVTESSRIVYFGATNDATYMITEALQMRGLQKIKDIKIKDSKLIVTLEKNHGAVAGIYLITIFIFFTAILIHYEP